jgi:hypothetical protein
MNEKIKQIEIEALDFACKITEQFRSSGLTTHDTEIIFREKFAELIVKECIGVVRSDGDHWEKLSQNPPRGQEQFRDHMLYSAYRLKEDAVWSIQDHFELEPSKPYGAE